MAVWTDSCPVSQYDGIARYVKYLEVSAIKFPYVRLVYVYRSLQGKLGCRLTIYQLIHSNRLWTVLYMAVKKYIYSLKKQNETKHKDRATAFTEVVSVEQLTCYKSPPSLTSLQLVFVVIPKAKLNKYTEELSRSS